MSLLEEMRRVGEQVDAKRQAEFDAKVEERAKQVADSRELSSVITSAAVSLFIVVMLVSIAWKTMRWCWT